MKIKVCGMCNQRNIRNVASLDIDMMGFIFWPESPRFVGDDQTLAHFLSTEPHLSVAHGAPKRVGVFVDTTIADIVWTATKYGLNCVQLHGHEDRKFVMELNDTLADTDSFDVEIIKAISVDGEEDLRQWSEYKDVVDMLLFDTKGPSAGGNGEQFSWDVLQAYEGDIPFLLSGGIGPGDVKKVLAFRHRRMAGIDLNSRFEVSAGLKSLDKLSYFVNEIRANEYPPVLEKWQDLG